MSRSANDRGAPFIIRILRKHITEWTGSARGVIFANPISHAFDYLIIHAIRIATFSAGWRIIAVYQAFRNDAMNEEMEDVYRRLKGMECELLSKGVLKKRYQFKPLDSLKALRAFLPQITVSDEIARTLNDSEKINSLLSLARPDTLTVTLDSLPSAFKPFSDLAEASLQGMIYFFKKPGHITWLISAGKLFVRGLDSQKVADSLFSLLEEIAHNLRNMMKAYSVTRQ